MDIRDLIIEKKDEIEYGKFYASTIVFENYIDENFNITTEGVGERLTSMKDKAVEFIKRVWKKVREWFENLVHNFKTFISTTSIFMKKNGPQIIMLYKKNADTLTLTSKSYNKYNPGMFELKIDTFMSNVNSMISRIHDMILAGNDKKFNMGRSVAFGGETVISADGKFDQELTKKAALNLIVSDPEVKERKLKDVLNLETFVNALDGKADFKDLKKFRKHIDGCFKGLASNVQHFKPKEGVQFDTAKFSQEATKWATVLGKVMTTVFSVYMAEVKNMNRITKMVVKRLYRTGKDDIKNSEPDESDKKLNADRWIFNKD